MSEKRQECTEESPMPVDAEGRWSHSRTEVVGDEYNGLAGGGDYEIHRCLNCGKRFYVELPD